MKLELKRLIIPVLTKRGPRSLHFTRNQSVLTSLTRDCAGCEIPLKMSRFKNLEIFPPAHFFILWPYFTLLFDPVPSRIRGNSSNPTWFVSGTLFLVPISESWKPSISLLRLASLFFSEFENFSVTRTGEKRKCAPKNVLLTITQGRNWETERCHQFEAVFLSKLLGAWIAPWLLILRKFKAGR